MRFPGAGDGLDFAPLACYITGDPGRRSTGERSCSGEHSTKGETMKKTIILTLGAVVAVLIAGYLTGAEDPPAATMQGAQVMQQPMRQPMTQPMQQPMQQPTETAEVSESFLILTACPMCHTCPVCQANCGTQHAMKCCVGKAKTTAANCEGDECCDDPPQTRHVMTNKADAVKPAAGHVRQQTAGQGMPPTVMQTDSGYLIIQTGN